MADVQLPAYLQNSRAPRLAERSTEGMGSALPPHISIRGNRFTLVDQAGDERVVETLHLDVCIADLSDHMNKLYYDKGYEPGSNDPPVCFSANGVAPSREAMQPQSQTCGECQWNIRGSATSKLSGQPIKACRDEKWLAVLIPGHKIIWQFRVTPGSFKNWKAYGEKFKNQPFDMKDVMTRLQFEADANGVITFQPVAFIDETTAKMREEAFQSKATDLIVGRLDQPIGLLPAPQGTVMSQQTATAAGLPIGGPTLQQPVKRTRGRPKTQEQPPAGNGPETASFRPAEPPAQAAPFGIQQNAPEPPNEMAQALNSFFKS
jgi:hypothetical protein